MLTDSICRVTELEQEAASAAWPTGSKAQSYAPTEHGTRRRVKRQRIGIVGALEEEEVNSSGSLPKVGKSAGASVQ